MRPMFTVAVATVVSLPLLSVPVVAGNASDGTSSPPQLEAAAAGSGLIRGKVRRPNGKPMKGVTVLAYPKRGTTHTTQPIAQAKTNRRGKYRLEVPRGGYRVLADGYRRLRTSQWYTDADVLSASKRVRARPIAKRISFTLHKPGGEIPQPILPTGTPRSPNFAGLPVDDVIGYEPQRKCRNEARPGTLALRELLLETFGEDVPAYLNRPCQSDTSEHYDGRAIDWMVDSRDLSQGSKGDAFVHWLLAERDGEPAAMARRLGVMYLVWRGRSWGQYRMEEGWREYRECSHAAYRSRDYDNDCHRNHIHISLNHAGAEQRTSWYQALG